MASSREVYVRSPANFVLRASTDGSMYWSQYVVNESSEIWVLEEENGLSFLRSKRFQLYVEEKKDGSFTASANIRAPNTKFFVSLIDSTYVSIKSSSSKFFSCSERGQMRSSTTVTEREKFEFVNSKPILDGYCAGTKILSNTTPTRVLTWSHSGNLTWELDSSDPHADDTHNVWRIYCQVDMSYLIVNCYQKYLYMSSQGQWIVDVKPMKFDIAITKAGESRTVLSPRGFYLSSDEDDPSVVAKADWEEHVKFRPTTLLVVSTNTFVFIGDSLVRRADRDFQLLEEVSKRIDPSFEKADLRLLAYGTSQIVDIRRTQLVPTLQLCPRGVVLCWDSDCSNVDENSFTSDEVARTRNEFTENLNAIITDIKSLGARVAVAGPGLLGENDLMTRSTFKNKPEMLTTYRDMIKSICNNLQVEYVDIREALQKAVPFYWASGQGCVTVDGEHLNAKGVGICADLFSRVLNKWMTEKALASPSKKTPGYVFKPVQVSHVAEMI